jgi:transcriptional regulator with XRE-family HTH domain
MRYQSEKIKELRLQTGLTVSEFARKMGTTRQKVLLWEEGLTRPNISSLEKICSAFDVEPGYFFV